MTVTLDINALLVKHGGLVPPHHVEVDAPDGVYGGLVRVTGKRGVVRGGQLRALSAALPGRVRVIGPVEASAPATPAPGAPEDAPPATTAAPAPAEPAQGNVGAPDGKPTAKAKRPLTKGAKATDDDDDW